MRNIDQFELYRLTKQPLYVRYKAAVHVLPSDDQKNNPKHQENIEFIN